MTGAVFGRYEIKGELGRGGMATVYHAFDPRFRRDVALKILPREFLHEQTFRARFEREAQSIAALEHSAIAPVYDFGEEEGQPFLVMRFMPGGSLTDRIQQGPLPLGGITAIMDRIGAALDFAHSKGIIHRDVKPANILFDEAGDPYLSDFGIVKVAETTAQLTGSGIVGTPAYMAPEMMERGDLTHLIDVYALGVTLFQMLTGQLPYEAATPIGVLMAHVSKPIPDARDLRPDLPDSIQMIIERAMAKDPVERYQRAGDLAADLRAVVSGGAPALQPPQTVRVPPEPTRPLPPDVRPDAGAGLATEPVAKAVTPPGDVVPQPAVPEEPIAVARPVVAERAAPRRGLPGWVWVIGTLAVALAAVVVLVGVLAAAGVIEFGGAASPTEEAAPAEEKAAPIEEAAPTEEAAPAVAEAIPAACETDAFGCAVFEPGETIKIGYAGPMAGDYAAFGTDISRGASLAIDDFWGFKEWAFELLIEDTGGTPEGGAAVANKYVSDPKVVAIAGHTFSGSTEAAIPIYDEAGYPMLSPSATNPKLTQMGYRVFNRIPFTDTQQGAKIADYLVNTLGLTRIAVMHNGSAYGQGLADAVWEEIEHLGGWGVAFYTFTPGETGPNAPLASIAALEPPFEPEALFFAGYDVEGAALVSEMETAGLGNVIFFSGDGIFGQNFLNLAGEDAEGTYATSLIPPASAAKDKFDADYEARWGEKPGVLSAFTWSGYDIVAALISVIKETAIVGGDGRLYIPRGALVENVRHLKDFPGLTGTITCNDVGDCNTAGPTFFQVQGGRWVEVK
jgi:branched-chain amino acid transport system substrate-binding protein